MPHQHEVYVKNKVRSAYGDELVCLVEFAGKGQGHEIGPPHRVRMQARQRLRPVPVNGTP